MKQQHPVIEQLRKMLPEYMAQRGQVVGSRGKKLIRCINPVHSDSTPSMSYYPKNQTLHCFGCGKSYDIFNVIAMDYPNCDTFPAQVRRACELFGLSVPAHISELKQENQPARQVAAKASGIFRVLGKSSPEQPIGNSRTDYTAFVEEKIKTCGVGGRYFESRGITKEICQKYRLFEWEGRAYLPVWEQGVCVSYCARSLDSLTQPRYKNSPGPMGIFGADYISGEPAGGALVVTESVFDALAAEVCGYQAVAICGAGNVSRFLRLCERYPETANSYLYITAGDNDQAGEAMNQTLRQGLREKGLSCTQLLLPAGCKDLNEALLSARSELEQALGAAENADRIAYEKESAAQAIGQLFQMAARRAQRGATSTGFAQTDELLGGGLYPGLYVLGAVSSIGKTSFFLQLADSITSEGKKDVLFFSLEMSRFELMAKSLSRISSQLAERGLTALEVMNAGQAMAYDRVLLIEQAVGAYQTGAARLFLREGIAEIGTEEIRQAVAEHIRLRGQKPVVMIDYLQILKAADPRATDKQNIDRAVVELKKISRDFDLPVLAVSSFNRENYRNTVSMEAFKESGAVEYSSDVLLGLQLAGTGESGFNSNAAKLKEPRAVELVLLKNRSGKPFGKVRFQYFAQFSRFAEQETKKRN